MNIEIVLCSYKHTDKVVPEKSFTVHDNDPIKRSRGHVEFPYRGWRHVHICDFDRLEHMTTGDCAGTYVYTRKHTYIFDDTDIVHMYVNNDEPSRYDETDNIFND